MCVSKVYVNKKHVPCRKCWECSMRRTNEWMFRIKQEVKDHQNSYFMTWQYNETNVPIYNLSLDQETGEIIRTFARGIHNAKGEFVRTIYYKDIQDYLKRLRKRYKLKYYIVPEYGEKKFRPHYHGILMTNEPRTTPFIKNLRTLWDTYTDGQPSGIQNGYVHQGDVVPNTIRYVIKYMSKRIKNTPISADEPKAYISKSLGISYVQRNRQYHLDSDRRYLVEEGGHKIPIPKFYKDKIWSTNKLTKEITNYLRNEERWNEFHKLSDYEKFVKNTLEENKISRATYEKRERQLNKSSKCKVI